MLIASPSGLLPRKLHVQGLLGEYKVENSFETQQEARFSSSSAGNTLIPEINFFPFLIEKTDLSE